MKVTEAGENEHPGIVLHDAVNVLFKNSLKAAVAALEGELTDPLATVCAKQHAAKYRQNMIGLRDICARCGGRRSGRLGTAASDAESDKKSCTHDLGANT